MAFLNFVVDETLAGRGASIKEVIIGNAVYARKPSYDPRIDSTVRVEARRLRNKLREYYAGDGASDRVHISLPTGRYTPVFSFQEPLGTDPSSTSAIVGQPIFTPGPGASVAVMPFRNLSPGPEMDSFADGLTDELMFALREAPGLRVTSRNTTFQYKDRSFSAAALAKEFGLDALFQGTVRREAENVRITIEVSDPSGYIVWTDRFDGVGVDLMQLQQQVATATLSRVRFDVSQMRALQISPGPGALKALGVIFRARQLLDQQTPSAIQSAIRLFSQVSDVTPDYARGYTGLVDCYCDLFRLGITGRETAISAVNQALQRALSMDPSSGEAHCARATVSAWFARDWAAAEAGFRHVLRFGENARAARLYGILLTIMQRHDEAAVQLEEARAIEPISTAQDIAEAISHYQARRFHLLVRWSPSEAGPSRLPGEAMFYTALAHIFGGKPAEAQRMLDGIERSTNRHPDLVFSRAELEARLGDPSRGKRLIEAEPKAGSRFAHATLAAALGETDRSMAALSEALDRSELSCIWLRTDQRFDAMRGNPEYRRLLQKLDPPDGMTGWRVPCPPTQ